MYRITRTGVYAFNRLTGERMEKPKRPSAWEHEHMSEWLPLYYQYISDMKKWDAFVAALPAEYVYKRPKLVHATEKGVPVPHLRSGGRRKYVNGAGVSANSRVLPHRYADEGDKGKGHRREIRRKERAQWLSEWQQEERETYAEEYDWTDYERLTDPRDYTWDGYEWDTDEYECAYCMGPCEL